MRQRGQSTLEYMILLILIIAAFIAIGNYFGRGVLGRWKAAVDDLGDQYDPRLTNGKVTVSLSANMESRVVSVPDETREGVWTIRTDQSNSLERRSGFTSVGGF